MLFQHNGDILTAPNIFISENCNEMWTNIFQFITKEEEDYHSALYLVCSFISTPYAPSGSVPHSFPLQLSG
jgi:hypothetical protein